MDPDLSEFSFGFALTSEFIARFGLERAGAPGFITQHAEAKKGGGYDAKLPGVPFYLQFKRRYRMVRRTAHEAGCLPSMPFFRMHLRRRDLSDQHQLLLDLEQQGNLVFYAAPIFDSTERLSEHYSSDRMIENSLFISPSAIGPLQNNGKHHVSFQRTGSAWYCSEPKKVQRMKVDELIEALRSKAVQAPVRDADKFYADIATELLGVFRRRGILEAEVADETEPLRNRRAPAEYAGLIARTLFDMELLVVPKEV